MADQELLLAFRRRLRRKAILTVIAAHAQLPEAPDVNRLYELQERNVLTWVVWRTADGPWLYDEEIGALVTTTLDVALGFIEAARESEKCSHTSTSVPGQPARRVTWLGIHAPPPNLHRQFSMLLLRNCTGRTALTTPLR
jgi:hypothetical protein